MSDALHCCVIFRDLSIDQLVHRYGSSGLQFYDHPPNSNISLELMETLAVERLKFLRLMEKHASASGKDNSGHKYSQEWRRVWQLTYIQKSMICLETTQTFERHRPSRPHLGSYVAY